MKVLAVIAFLKVAIPIVLRDCAGIGGGCLIVYGVSQVNIPAAFIVAGAMLVAAAWLSARGS